MKPIWGMFLEIEQRPLNKVPMGAEVGIPCDRCWEGEGKTKETSAFSWE
jgi:hypothetical protein